MLTFTGVVFSTTLVAIQLAGGQYSPRVVRVFVRSTLTHVTLGIFLATFVFALNTLVETRDGSGARVPTFTILALYVMVVATLAAFITFCHGIVRLLRVQYLLRTVALHAREAIERFVPAADAYRRRPRADARRRAAAHPQRPPDRAWSCRSTCAASPRWAPRPAAGSSCWCSRASTWASAPRWRASTPPRPRRPRTPA